MSGQIGIALGGLLVVAVAPPTRGTMLLMPLTPRPTGELVNLALAGGARIAAAGPLPGSLIVEGERAALLGPLARRGVLVAAAAAQGCAEGAR